MTARDRRALAVGLAVVATAWLGLRGVPRARAWVVEEERKVEAGLIELERALRVVGELGPLADSIARLEADAGRLPHALLVGSDAGTAGFDLTTRLTLALAGESEAFVERIEPLADSTAAARLARASVRAHVETDVIGLLEIARTLEEDPAMAIAALSVRSLDPLGVAAPDGPERLDVFLTVTGWYRPPPDPEGPGGVER